MGALGVAEEFRRPALVAALASGLIDVVMSDHNPQDVEVKRLPFAEAAAGAVGLQTMLPAALRLIHGAVSDLQRTQVALRAVKDELNALNRRHLNNGVAGERRLGEFFRRKTLMFNGYGDQVASLYAGMDLRKSY